MALGRKTGGRGPGVRNKRPVAREEATAEAATKIRELVPDAFDGDSLALLQAIYRDPSHEMPLRLDAAKAALRFERPALAAIEHGAKDGTAIQIEIVRFSDRDPPDPHPE